MFCCDLSSAAECHGWSLFTHAAVYLSTHDEPAEHTAATGWLMDANATDTADNF